MNPKMPETSEAYRRAHAGVAQVVSWATISATSEREQIQAANEPKVSSLRRRDAFLANKSQHLSRRISDVLVRSAARPAPLPIAVVALFFVVAGFVLSRETIKPFNLGAIGNLFSAGLSLLAPFATDRLVRRFSFLKVVGVLLDLTLFITAAATLVTFGEIRADVFAHQMDPGEAVVFETGNSIPSLPDSSAEEVSNLLRWAMILAALGFELGCGLAWHEFSEARIQSDTALLKSLEKELRKVEEERLAVWTRIQEYLAEPSQTYAAFWSEVQQGLSDGMAAMSRSVRTWLILAPLLVLPATVRAADLQVVVNIDFSKTEKVGAPGGVSQFQENQQAVSRLLHGLPADSYVTVLGVSDNSMMNPLVLLSAHVSSDSGYFGSRLRAARQSLVATWKGRIQDVEPSAPHTDLVGAALYSAEILARSTAKRRVLAYFSDMRQEDSRGLDLEHPKVIDVGRALEYVEKWKLVPELRGVEVFVFGAGAHDTSRDLRYWRSLEEFWTEYFRRAGANLRVFSPGREAGALTLVTAPRGER